MKNSDLFFYFVLILVISICTILNYDANLMGSMLPLYVDFENFFKSNLDYSYKFANNFYTFPMWGYGLILLLFKNKLVIILLQQSLTFFTILLIDKEINRYYKFVNIFIFRFLILISVHWFFFHTSLWPYSFNANLLQLSILYLSKYFRTKENKFIIIASILYGILLNLRSDYYYFMIVIIIILIIQSIQISNVKAVVIFIVITNMLLIPWGIYTFKRTNHYLQTSTNSGHVFYISLGQLPNNIWKINPIDEDSSMHELLIKKQVSYSNVNTLTYESSQILLNQWKNNIINSPFEYLKKCSFNIIRIFANPFYPGSLEKHFSSAEKITKVKIKIKYYFNNLQLINLIRYFTIGEAKFYLITFTINLLGVFIFFSWVIFNLFILYKKKVNFYKINILFLLSNLIILYQISMCIFVFFMPIYNTNIFISYIISISFAYNELKKFDQKKLLFF